MNELAVQASNGTNSKDSELKAGDKVTIAGMNSNCFLCIR